MSEKSHENFFKFSIYQGKNVIIERIFDADCFNPVIRYSVDIRSMIPDIIQKLQNTLSQKNLSFNKINEDGEVQYNFIKEYQDVCHLFNVNALKLKKPPYIKKEINGKIFEGTQCRFGLYINNNPIVERDFQVEDFNPAVRFSYEIVEVTREIVDLIFLHLKDMDVIQLWEDYNLIKVYGFYIIQIRELNYKRRRELIDKSNDPVFVRKVRNEYRIFERENRSLQNKE